VCLLFAFRNCPIATPHGASEVHSRGGPDLKGIAPSNILRTCGSGRINSLQIRLAIGLRTRATLTKKSIAGRARISAPSSGKQSKDLHAHADQIHSDRGAAHRKSVENECLHFRYPNWFSGSRRRVRSENFSARMWPPWHASASSAARGRRHVRRPQARQAHKRYVHVHPPVVGSFSRSGSYLILRPQCSAPPSSAARGCRHDRRLHAQFAHMRTWLRGASPRATGSIFSACIWLHRNAPASSAARGRRHDRLSRARCVHRRMRSFFIALQWAS